MFLNILENMEKKNEVQIKSKSIENSTFMTKKLHISFILSNCSNHSMGIDVMPLRRPFVCLGKHTPLLGQTHPVFEANLPRFVGQ